MTIPLNLPSKCLEPSPFLDALLVDLAYLVRSEVLYRDFADFLHLKDIPHPDPTTPMLEAIHEFVRLRKIHDALYQAYVKTMASRTTRWNREMKNKVRDQIGSHLGFLPLPSKKSPTMKSPR